MNEHGFVRKVHRALKEERRLTRIWKINDNFQGGVPDAFYCAKNQLWVEYKYISGIPKRESTVVTPDVSELQYEWLEGLQKSGIDAWVVVGHPKGVLVITDLDECRQGYTTKALVEKSIPFADFIQSLLYICTRP